MPKLLTCNALPALSPLTAQIDALTDCKCVWSALTMTHMLVQDCCDSQLLVCQRLYLTGAQTHATHALLLECQSVPTS